MRAVKLVNQHRYTVLGFDTSISPIYRRQLLAMGILPGCEFKVNRFAPMGNTIEIEINHFNLTVRLQEFTGVLFQEAQELPA